MLLQRVLPALLLNALNAIHLVASQATINDYILLVADPGWKDLSKCAQSCLECFDLGCTSVVNQSQCTTNKCLCRPSYLGTGLTFVYTCVRDRCKDISGAETAQNTYKAYCAAKGYTDVLAPAGSTTAQSNPTPIAGTLLNTLATKPASSNTQDAAASPPTQSALTQPSPNPTASSGSPQATANNSAGGDKALGPAEIVGIVIGVLSLIVACLTLVLHQRKKKSNEVAVEQRPFLPPNRNFAQVIWTRVT